MSRLSDIKVLTVFTVAPGQKSVPVLDSSKLYLLVDRDFPDMEKHQRVLSARNMEYTLREVYKVPLLENGDLAFGPTLNFVVNTVRARMCKVVIRGKIQPKTIHVFVPHF